MMFIWKGGVSSRDGVKPPVPPAIQALNLTKLCYMMQLRGNSAYTYILTYVAVTG